MYNKNKKFSLIELLLVMVISAIMLGIVIPTFHKITKGVNVEAAARQLGAQLKAVREYAITNREYVALIMESVKVNNTKKTGGDLKLPAGYKFLAYRPCIVDENGSDWDFSSWVEGERWEFLPDGAQIENMSNFNSDQVNGIRDSKVNGLNNPPKDGLKPVVVFSPTGKCVTLSSNASVTVGETVGSDNETHNHINITIAAYTGRVSYGDQ